MHSAVGLEPRGDLRYEIVGRQIASVTLDPEDVREEPAVFQARLLNLSRKGAKFSVPVEFPLQKTLRIKLSVDDLALSLFVAAEVCWSEPDGNGGHHVGCSLNPSIPPGVFDRFAVDGRLDRRGSGRYTDTLGLRAIRKLSRKGEVVTLRNYSRGGFCMLSRRPAQPGERIEISVDERGRLSIAAKTQWQVNLEKQYLIGCTFLDEKDFGRLQSYCQMLAERQANG